MKVIDKWNDGGNGLNLVNFKMENGDLNTIEWNSFKGTDSTMVRIYNTKEDGTTVELKVIMYKEMDLKKEGLGYKLEMHFEGEDINEIVESEITNQQMYKPNKQYFADKINQAIYSIV